MDLQGATLFCALGPAIDIRESERISQFRSD